MSRGCPDVLYHSNEVYKCKIFIITVVYLQYSLHLLQYYQEPDMNTASRPLKRKKSFYVVLFYWVCVARIIYAYNVYANISHVHYTSQIHLLYLFIVR